MDECWLENEEFNFDIPLSPLLGENVDDKKPVDDAYDDEVFFGPVGHLERCAAVVAKKETVEPLKPLEPKEQALLLQESAKISSILKYKPLNTLQGNSPVAVVFPFKRDSPGVDIGRLRSFKEKIANKENIENDRNGNSMCPSKMEPETLVHEKTDKHAFNSSIELRTDKRGAIPTSSSLLKKPQRRSSNGSSDGKQNTSRIAMMSGIPKMQSKIARPSSIPSLKPGLLQPKIRPRGVTQDSKTKPMKATHLEATNMSVIETTNSKIKLTDKTKTTCKPLSTSSFTTPNKIREPKHVRCNTGEQQIHRKSNNLNSSLSKLQFSKPSHNSTPIRPITAEGKISRRSIAITGSARKVSASSISKTKQDRSSITTHDTFTQGTPNGRPSMRRSLHLKQTKSSPDETSVQSKNNPQRGSLLKCPSRSSLLPSPKAKEKRKSLTAQSNIKRTGTFVFDQSTFKAQENVSLIDADNEIKYSVIRTSGNLITEAAKIDTNECQASTVIRGTLDHQSTPMENVTDILIPEVPLTQRSPLLKFDSPMAENIAADPFVTGNTPPAVPVSDVILAPEQIEANLIQF